MDELTGRVVDTDSEQFKRWWERAGLPGIGRDSEIGQSPAKLSAGTAAQLSRLLSSRFRPLNGEKTQDSQAIILWDSATQPLDRTYASTFSSNKLES